jgi:hypothetical protein
MTAPTFEADPAWPLAQPWRGSAEDLVEATRGLAPRWWLRGPRMRTKLGLLDECAAAVQFPPHFGGTWDALRDALSDLPEGGTFLVLGADQLLQEAPPAEAEIFWQVLRQAQADLRPKPFHLVLQVGPEGYDTLVEGLRAMGLD